MKKLLVFVVLVAALAASQAWAAEEYLDIYPCMPGCCTFECIMVDFTCGYCCDSSTPLTIEFLDMQQNVLGTAQVRNWCCGEVTAHLDQPVDSNMVCTIRLRKETGSCCVSWASIRVLCENQCDCPKWKMAYKGDLWCWQPVPAAKPAPAPELEPAPAPAAVAETEPAPAPEPEQSFDYFPPAEEEKETMNVEGRG